jgi:hypothetical protein
MNYHQKGVGMEENPSLPIIKISPSNLINLIQFIKVIDKVEIGNKVIPLLARKFSISPIILVYLLQELGKDKSNV